MIISAISTGVLGTRLQSANQESFNSAAKGKDKGTEQFRTLTKTYTSHNSIIVDLAFPPPIVNSPSSYDSIEVPDLPKHGAPGEPILPYKTVKLLIPQGKELQSISITHSNKKPLEGRFNLEYGKTPLPVSSSTPVVDQPNQAIYSSTTPFPGVLLSQVSEQYLRGYKILLLTLHPVQYIPKTRELLYFQTVTVTINLMETNEISPMFRNLPKDTELVLSLVDNPETVETYTDKITHVRPTSIVNSSESYNYVIITNDALNSSFQPLIEDKILKGLNATTVLVEDILNDPDYFCDGLFGDGCGSQFNGTAARIRNFIKDAYQNWGTEYVLLGGDSEIIPIRGVYAYVGDTVDRNIPCDMYYGALDGSWNNDNDTIFGEGVFDEESPENGTAGEEADFFAEVYIGRATVDTAEEVTNFVNKTLEYEQSTDESYLKKALMIGEELDDETEAGNSKDLVTDIIPQYTTKRLYHRDGTFSVAAVMNELNSGTHIVNHDGHANSQFVMGMGTSAVDSLTNDKYYMIYSLGCYAAAFDEDEAIAEHFIFNSGGAFAFIGNSRYGWYVSGMTIGPGETFDRSFFSVLNGGIRNLGKALQLSKENQYSQSVERWTYFNLNLLGDPETEIVTDFMAPVAHFQTVTDFLTSPALKQSVDLNGTAKRGTDIGATFANFTIKFGEGRYPTSWQSQGINLTHNGQNEIEDDVLATWNTSVVTPGIYTLKLTVTDEEGRVGEDWWIVRVIPPPAVCVNPPTTEVQAGQTFTVEINITDIEELWKLDIQMNWNTTILDYVSHEVKIPVENYVGGVLHMPATINQNKVNQTTGTYQVVARSESESYPFTGSGTVFEMTFQTKANGTDVLKLSSTLLNRYLQPLSHVTINGIIEIAPGVHDISVTDISPARTVAGQGNDLKINVTISNYGTFGEILNVTAYANGTVIGTSQDFVVSGNWTTITIIWNTTGWTMGNYIISSDVAISSEDANASDNSLVDGWVFMTISGDVDGDRDIDIYDVVKITAIYWSQVGDPEYKCNSDIDGNGIIDIYDVVKCTSHYGESW
jgi:hypothetical protein